MTLNIGSKPRSNASDDDDDFLVLSDSEDDAKSIKSSTSRSSTSSRRSVLHSDESDDEDAPKTKNGKSKSTSTKSKAFGAKKGTSAQEVASSGAGLFLTAAERREQGKKDGKKATEDPYAFLLDVQDVWNEFQMLSELTTILFTERGPYARRV